MKSCSYCDQCSPGILRDRIILGLFQGDIREELLKKRKLTSEKNLIDICKAMESAATHCITLQTDSLNKISSKQTKTSLSGVHECKFCLHTSIHMIKERCKASGKSVFKIYQKKSTTTPNAYFTTTNPSKLSLEADQI